MVFYNLRTKKNSPLSSLISLLSAPNFFCTSNKMNWNHTFLIISFFGLILIAVSENVIEVTKIGKHHDDNIHSLSPSPTIDPSIGINEGILNQLKMNWAMYKNITSVYNESRQKRVREVFAKGAGVYKDKSKVKGNHDLEKTVLISVISSDSVGHKQIWVSD